MEPKSESIQKWHVFSYVILSLFSFLCMQYTFDLSHTVSCAYALLDGHVRDFYQYCFNHYNEINYTLSTYLVFALWNIPAHLLGAYVDTYAARPSLPLYLIYYNKIFLVLLFFYTSYIMKLIISKFCDSRKAKMCSLAFLFMPVAFWVQFCLGLYDIITVLFMMIGLYLYISSTGNRNKKIVSIVFWGLAITCKTMSLLYFIPLVLLKEKKIIKIISEVFIGLIPYIICVIVFHNDNAFINGVLKWNITDLLHYTDIWFLNIPTFVLLLVYAWCYFADSEIFNEYQLFKSVVFASNMVSFAFFGLCLTHPNWMLLATPYWIFAWLIHRRPNGYLISILVLSIAYFIFFANMPGPHSEGLIREGLLGKKGFDLIEPVFTITSFLGHNIKQAYSIMSAMIFILAAYAYPKFLVSDENEVDKNSLTYLLLVSFLQVILVLLTCFSTGHIKGEMFSVYDGGRNGVVITEDNKQISQKIYNKCSEWNRIELWPITWDNEYSDKEELTVSIIDTRFNKVVFTKNINLNSMPNNAGYVEIINQDINLDRNQWYEVTLRNNSAKKVGFMSAPKSYLRVGEGTISGDDDNTLLLKIVGK